jgi:predicted Zn-dependent peptidase
MQNNLQTEKAAKVASFNGIDVFRVFSEKFKTNTINVFFHDNLSRESVTKNALIPAVLRRGCERFPTFRDIAFYLEELFGASFDCGVSKKGERQITQFYIEFVAEKYTGEGTDIFNKAFDLLLEIITKPVLVNGVFKSEYIDQEKENLSRLIKSRVNDKVQYAVDKCLEEMCRDEPFGIYEYGDVSQLESIDESDLYQHYRNALKTCPVSVYVGGNVDENGINSVVEKLKQLERGKVRNVDITSVEAEVGEVKHVEERMDVTQGKLSLGFRTGISSNESDYYKLLVYNGILGGGIHSKLFQNVREKASLAYYIFSRLEKFKGLMLISGGVEAENRDKTVDIVMSQLDEIKKGNISDYEMDSTLKTIETGMKSLKDNQLHIVDFYLSQFIVNTNDDFDTIIEKVKKVTKDDVVRVAGRIRLDTVYFLAPETKEEQKGEAD